MLKSWSVKLVIIMMVGNCPAALAQFSNGNEQICYMSQQAFSIGSTFRSDAELLKCVRTENGAMWEVAENTRPMSCMHDNTYYSPGALLETASGEKTMACQTTGKWQAVTDAKE